MWLLHTWRKGVAALTLSLLGCGTAPERSPPDVRVAVMDLHATVDGRELPQAALLRDPTALRTENALARVSWSSYWNRGGSVLFLADSTVCVRRPRPLGQPIRGEEYDASTATGAELINIDYTGAEVVALEAGFDLKRTIPWLLVGTNAKRPGAAGRQGALHAAKQMLAAGVASRVLVGLLPEDSAPDLRLLLVPPDKTSMITDAMAVTLIGPAATVVPPDVLVLHEGPETVQTIMDGMVVEVWHGADSRVWTAPLEDYTQKDRAWSNALRRVLEAVGHGCAL